MGKAIGAFVIVQIIVAILALAGWVQCLVKFVNCDFKEPYKAEIIYGIGTFTGAGAIIGWINIDDTPATPVAPVTQSQK